MDTDNGVEVATTPSQRLQYGDGHTVTLEFRDDLTNGAMYTATALFWTFAEDDASITTPVEVSKTFCKHCAVHSANSFYSFRKWVFLIVFNKEVLINE